MFEFLSSLVFSVDAVEVFLEKVGHELRTCTVFWFITERVSELEFDLNC
jgi:hypothetical protein